MKNLKDSLINEARVDWRNVHDAVLNTLKKYSWKPGVSKDVIEYCNKVRDALESIK